MASWPVVNFCGLLSVIPRFCFYQNVFAFFLCAFLALCDSGTCQAHTRTRPRCTGPGPKYLPRGTVLSEGHSTPGGRFPGQAPGSGPGDSAGSAHSRGVLFTLQAHNGTRLTLQQPHPGGGEKERRKSTAISQENLAFSSLRPSHGMVPWERLVDPPGTPPGRGCRGTPGGYPGSVPTDRPLGP